MDGSGALGFISGEREKLRGDLTGSLPPVPRQDCSVLHYAKLRGSLVSAPSPSPAPWLPPSSFPFLFHQTYKCLCRAFWFWKSEPPDPEVPLVRFLHLLGEMKCWALALLFNWNRLANGNDSWRPYSHLHRYDFFHFKWSLLLKTKLNTFSFFFNAYH